MYRDWPSSFQASVYLLFEEKYVSLNLRCRATYPRYKAKPLLPTSPPHPLLHILIIHKHHPAASSTEHQTQSKPQHFVRFIPTRLVDMSDSNNSNPSTLQSYVDSATGAVQSAIGSVTGSTGDQAKGQTKQDKADVEDKASHAAVKGPGFAAPSSGAVTKDDPDRTSGSWNQTIGSAKETVGGLVGSEVCLGEPPSTPQREQPLTRTSRTSRPPGASRTSRASSRRPRVSSTTWAAASRTASRARSAGPWPA